VISLELNEFICNQAKNAREGRIKAYMGKGAQAHPYGKPRSLFGLHHYKHETLKGRRALYLSESDSNSA